MVFQFESLFSKLPVEDNEKEAMEFMRRLTCFCVFQIAGCRKAVPAGSLRKIAVRDQGKFELSNRCIR